MHEVRCIIIKSSIALMYCPSFLCTKYVFMDFMCTSDSEYEQNAHKVLLYYSHYHYLLCLPVVTIMLAMTVRVDLHYSKEQQINTT